MRPIFVLYRTETNFCCLPKVDILSQNYNICARVAGGSNAGHTIVVGDKTFKFHLLPSGMLHPGTMGVIGNGVVVHIPTLLEEMKVRTVPRVQLAGLLVVVVMPLCLHLVVVVVVGVANLCLRGVVDAPVGPRRHRSAVHEPPVLQTKTDDRGVSCVCLLSGGCLADQSSIYQSRVSAAENGKRF